MGKEVLHHYSLVTRIFTPLRRDFFFFSTSNTDFLALIDELNCRSSPPFLFLSIYSSVAVCGYKCNIHSRSWFFFRAASFLPSVLFRDWGFTAVLGVEFLELVIFGEEECLESESLPFVDPELKVLELFLLNLVVFLLVREDPDPFFASCFFDSSKDLWCCSIFPLKISSLNLYCFQRDSVMRSFVSWLPAISLSAEEFQEGSELSSDSGLLLPEPILWHSALRSCPCTGWLCTWPKCIHRPLLPFETGG